MYLDYTNQVTQQQLKADCGSVVYISQWQYGGGGGCWISHNDNMVEVVNAESRLQQVQGQADTIFIPFSGDPDEWEILELQFSYFNFIPKLW